MSGLDIDITYLIQFGLFLVCLVSVNGILLQPFLKVIEEREAKTAGALADVVHLRALGDADMHAYQAKLRSARSQADQARERLKQSGRDEERRLLGDLRVRITSQLNATRETVALSEETARAELHASIDPLAGDLVAKLLRGRP
jgi:F-type H+-transporting ATPase subunit b